MPYQPLNREVVRSVIEGSGAASRVPVLLHLWTHAAVKSERILPHEDVRALMDAAATFHIQNCICRKEQEIAGHRAYTFPLHNCMGFSSVARKPVDGDITRVDAARCIGCGLCVTGCAPQAVHLERLPDAEVVELPEDFAAREGTRLASRGIGGS